MYLKFIRYYFIIFLLVGFILDFELFWIVFLFLNVHLYVGIKSILKDYIHHAKLKFLFDFLVKLFLVFILNLTLEIIF